MDFLGNDAFIQFMIGMFSGVNLALMIIKIIDKRIKK